jgi:hypothetical protein
MRFAWLLHSVILLATLNTVAAPGIFDGHGVAVTAKAVAMMEFPKDLEKTNLHIVTSTPKNPFEWAGRIYAPVGDGLAPCSGGVVALPGYRPTDKVLVLTAGHCLRPHGEFLKPHEVQVNGTTSAYFSFPRPRWVKTAANGAARALDKVPFSRVVFAAFDGIDLALLEMDLTYDQLKDRGQKPPLLARPTGAIGEAVSSFGIPEDEAYKSRRFHLALCRTRASALTSGTSSFTNVGPDAYSLQNRVAVACTSFGGMSGGYVRNVQGGVIGVNSLLMGEVPYFASVQPLLNCATAEGRLDESCLAILKTKIESGGPR